SDALFLRELVDHAGNDGGQVCIPDRRRDAKSRLDEREDLLFVHADHPLPLRLRFGFSGSDVLPSSSATYPSAWSSSTRSPSYSSPARYVRLVTLHLKSLSTSATLIPPVRRPGATARRSRLYFRHRILDCDQREGL